MIPLNYATLNEVNVIKKIDGDEKIKEHLQSLNIKVGSRVAIVNTVGGDFILSIDNVRVAISKELAQKVMI
jgi:ferrous iron transport protein A